MVNRLGFNFLSRFFFLALSFLKYVVSSCYRRLKTWTYIVCCVTNCKYPHVIRTSSPVTTSHLACEQAPSEGGKKFGERKRDSVSEASGSRSVNPRAKHSLVTRPLSARPARPVLHSASSLWNQPGACSQASSHPLSRTGKVIRRFKKRKNIDLLIVLGHVIIAQVHPS